MSEIMPEQDRVRISQNPYQGLNKRVLCVCSGGILRSPTAAFVLSCAPYNFNTRAGGTLHYALIKVDGVLVGWADEIVCMERHHAMSIFSLAQAMADQTHYPKVQFPPVKMLDIEDCYAYRDPQLIKLIQTKYDKALPVNKADL